MENQENGLWDIEQLCNYLRLKKSAVYGMTMRRELPYLKIGKRLRFRKTDIDRYLEKLANEN